MIRSVVKVGECVGLLEVTFQFSVAVTSRGTADGTSEIEVKELA